MKARVSKDCQAVLVETGLKRYGSFMYYCQGKLVETGLNQQIALD